MILLRQVGDIKSTTYFLSSVRALPLHCDFYITRLYHPRQRRYVTIVMMTETAWRALKGMYEEAIAEKQKVVDLTGGLPRAIGSLGWTYAMAGQRKQARKLLDTLTERAQHEPISRMYFGWIHMGLGELDQAFAEYDKAYEERSETLPHIKASWADNLRADPRYRALLQKLGLPPD